MGVAKQPHAARPWLYLGLVIVGFLAIAAAGAWFTRHQAVDSAKLFTPDAGVNVVSYRGQAYLTDTERLALPDAQMIAIGQTREGYTVYAQRSAAGYGGGGGGGSLSPPAGSVTPGPAYLKTVDGRFVPLVPQ